MGRAAGEERRSDDQKKSERLRLEVVQALNKYAVKLYRDKNEHEFSLEAVSNKIDLKSKARDFYKKYTASTQTGAAVGDGCGGNAGNLDLAAAGAEWGNFKLWHKTFSYVPGYGPISSLSSAQVLSVPASPVRVFECSSVRSTPKVFFAAYHHEQEVFFNKEVKKGFLFLLRLLERS